MFQKNLNYFDRFYEFGILKAEEFQRNEIMIKLISKELPLTNMRENYQNSTGKYFFKLGI